jgi:hypothetical protein
MSNLHTEQDFPLPKRIKVAHSSSTISEAIKDVCSIDNLVADFVLSSRLESDHAIPLKSVACHPRISPLNATKEEICQACSGLQLRIYNSREKGTLIELPYCIYQTELIISGLTSESELWELARKLRVLTGSKIESSSAAETRLGKLLFPDPVQTITAWRILHLIQIEGRGFQAKLMYISGMPGIPRGVNSPPPASTSHTASPFPSKPLIAIEKPKPLDQRKRILVTWKTKT